MPNTQNHCKLSNTVVWFLGVNATMLIGGIIATTLISKTPDAAFFALAGGALGNLGNLVNNAQQQGQRRADNAPLGTMSDPLITETTGTDGGAVVVEEK